MRIITDIKKAGCPSWALDILEELGHETTHVTTKNVYDMLSMAIKKNEILSTKFPHLLDFLLQAVINEIVFKPERGKIGKREIKTKKKLKALFELLNEELKIKNSSLEPNYKYKYVPKYVAEEMGITSFEPIQKSGDGHLFHKLGEKWEKLDPEEQYSEEVVKQYVDGKHGNKYAKRILSTFIPVKIPK